MVVIDPRLILLLGGAGLIVFLLAMRFDPASRSGRMITRVTTGFVLLLAWNAFVPLRLGVNPLSAWIAGMLGLPGLGLLAVLNALP